MILQLLDFVLEEVFIMWQLLNFLEKIVTGQTGFAGNQLKVTRLSLADASFSFTNSS